MAIVMISDAATDTVAQYDEAIQKHEAAGHGNPPGRLSHVAALKGTGYFVVDVGSPKKRSMRSRRCSSR